MANVLNKDFKTIIFRMLKELKEDKEESRKLCVNKTEILIERKPKKKSWS